MADPATRSLGLIGVEEARRDLWDLYPEAPALFLEDETAGSGHVLWTDQGVELRFDRQDGARRLTAVFLKLAGDADSKPYWGPLPMELAPGFGAAEIEALLGPPDETGGDPGATASHERAWLAYDLEPGLRLHVNLGGDGIEKVTICAPGTAT